VITRVLFLVISSLGLLAALGTVLARNLIHAALFLVAFFFCVACQFILLEVEFLAAIQVLVYIGAVAILILFGIMLTRNIQGDETTTGGWSRRGLAIVAALAILGLLIAGIRHDRGANGRPAWTAERPPDAAAGPDQDVLLGMTSLLGREMMSRYLIAFELTALLLTVAVVGAIALAYRDLPGESASRSEPGTQSEPGADASPNEPVIAATPAGPAR
jgi:NADH:ubiquinone oxidoreductase subunit 6 (subunit J)